MGKKAIHLYYAAVCYFQSRAYEKALALFDTLLIKHPDKVTLTWKEILVNILFSLDKHKDALPHLEELARETLPPKQKKWQEILLHQYLSLDMDQKALSYANYLTRKDSLEPKWWKTLSHIHLKNSNLKDSQRKGLAALIIYGFLTPMTREEMVLAADLYLTLDVPQKAAALYEDVLNQSHDSDILKKLTQAFAMAHDSDNAIKWIDKGLLTAFDPDQPGIVNSDLALLTMKAQLLYIKKSYEKAAVAYEQVAQQCAASGQSGEPDKLIKFGKTGQAWLMMGYSFMNCSRLERADKAFKMAAQFKKQRKQAIKALAQIKSMQKILEK